MRLVRWFIWITATIIALAVAVVGMTGIVIGTETGTRWLIRLAEERAPGELVIEEPSGVLLRGVLVSRFEWRSESLRITAEALTVNVDLLPLFQRRLHVRHIGAETFGLEFIESEPAEEPGGGIDVNLPVSIAVEDAAFGKVVIRRDGTPYEIDELAFAAALEGPRLDIPRISGRAFGTAAELAARFRLAGSVPLRIGGTWRQADGGGEAFGGSVELEGEAGRYTVRHDLTSPFGVETRGELRLGDDGFGFDLRNRWDAIDRTLADRRVITDGGTLHIDGSLDAFDVDLDTVAAIEPVPVTRIELDGVSSLDTLQIDRLFLNNEFGTATVSGSATRTPVPALDIAFDLSGFDPARLSDRLAGEVAARGTATLRLPESGVRVTVAADSVSGTLNGETLDAAVAGQYLPDAIVVDRVRLRLGSNEVTGAGSWGESVRLDADASLAALSELSPAVGGSAEVSVALSGPRAMPGGRIRIDAAALTVGGLELDSASVTVAGNMAEHTIGAELAGYGMTAGIEASGALAQNGDGAGWLGEIAVLNLESPRLGRWVSGEPFPLALNPGLADVGRVCLEDGDGPAIACLAGAYAADAESRFEASIENLPVTDLPLPLPAGVQSEGTVRAAASGSWLDRSLSAELSLDVDGGALSTVYEGEETGVGFAEFRVTGSVTDNALVSGARIALTEDRGNLSATLTDDDLLDTAAPIGGEIDITLGNADLFAVFLPAIENPRGRIDGRVEIGGNLAAPTFAGEVLLADGGFSVRPAGIDVTDVSLRAQQRDTGRFTVSGSANSGDGRISIEGLTEAGTETGIRSEISIEGQDFLLLKLPDWRVETSPDIDIVFDEKSAVVTGTLGIPEASIKMQDLPTTAVRPSPDAVVHEAGVTEQREGRRIEIEVEAVLGDEVRYEGFGLATNLTGAVDIRGGSQQPYVGYGQVDLVGGRYEAYGQDLTIERGQLIFAGPLDNPTLDVRATRTVGDVVAGLVVTGPPSRLRSEVFSEPPMNDADTLSYLLRGRPLSSGASSGEGDFLNNAAFALGMSGAGSIAAEIGNALGLDTLTVEGGSENSRVVAGTRIGDRLRVEYGYGLIDKLGTLLLKYQINNRLSLESRTGTVSNLDIVYSVKKK